MELYLIRSGTGASWMTMTLLLCARDEQDARRIHPGGGVTTDEETSDWCAVQDVEVTHLGSANNNLDRGVVLASYNAGGKE